MARLAFGCCGSEVGLESLYDDEEDDPEVRKSVDHGFRTVARMREPGAHVIDDVKTSSAHSSAGEAPALMRRIIRNEMRTGLGAYSRSLNNTSGRTLEDLVRFSHENPMHRFSENNPSQSYLERALNEALSQAKYEAHLWGVDQGIDYAL